MAGLIIAKGAYLFLGGSHALSLLVGIRCILAHLPRSGKTEKQEAGFAALYPMNQPV